MANVVAREIANVTINTLEVNEKLNNITEVANETQDSHIESDYFSNLSNLMVGKENYLVISYSCIKEKRGIKHLGTLWNSCSNFYMPKL